MITAVDTSVLLDVFAARNEFTSVSADALRAAINRGSIVACEVVWSETAAAFGSTEAFSEIARQVGLKFSAIELETAATVAKSWRNYRLQSGKRTRLIADFMVGAHALVQADALLTRDHGFYRKYFGKLPVVNPSRT